MLHWTNLLLQKSLARILFTFLAIFVVNNASAISGPWVEIAYAKVRLIAVGNPMSGKLTAGLEFELEKGWKTYWRYPGDSGVAPSFDWSNSSNVAEVQTMFPAPARFNDDYGTSIGYKGYVLFPANLMLTNAGSPTKLSVDFFVGICREVCIPVKQNLSLSIPPLLVPNKDEVEKVNYSLYRVPLQSSLSELSVTLKSEPSKDGLFSYSLKIPKTQQIDDSEFEIQDLFVEGPEGWAPPLPKYIGENEGLAEWKFNLIGGPINRVPINNRFVVTFIGNSKSYTADYIPAGIN